MSSCPSANPADYPPAEPDIIVKLPLPADADYSDASAKRAADSADRARMIGKGFIVGQYTSSALLRDPRSLGELKIVGPNLHDTFVSFQVQLRDGSEYTVSIVQTKEAPERRELPTEPGTVIVWSDPGRPYPDMARLLPAGWDMFTLNKTGRYATPNQLQEHLGSLEWKVLPL